MKNYLKKFALAGVISGLLASPLKAADGTHVIFVGGNATSKLVQDRWSTLFGGTLFKNSTNSSLIFRYTNSVVPGVPGTVTADFNLTGGAGAIVDLQNGTPVTLQDNTKGVPTAALSAVAPETVGIDGSQFTEIQSVVVPVVFVKNTNSLTALAGVTNLTQRNAALLETAAGTLTANYFAGDPYAALTPANTIYFVGRNNISAVRQLIDANIYNSGGANNYTTNASGKPIKYTIGSPPQPWGAGSGPEVIGIVNSISNSIGTVAPQDVNSSVAVLAYEGVPYSTTNVINGSYPIWGVEQYLYWPSGLLAPTTDQTTVIGALESAVADVTYGHTSPLFVGNFVEIGDIQVSRTGDGGPITPNN